MKKIKSIFAVALTGAMMLSMAGCNAKIEAVSQSDFESAVEDNIDTDIDEYAEEGYENLYLYTEDIYIDYFVYDDASAAEDVFDEAFDAFSDAKDDGNFSGSSRNISTDDYKYFVFDGNSDEESLFGELSDSYEYLVGGLDSYCHGGVYWVDDTVIVVVTTNKDKDYTSCINSILGDLSYPRP